MDGACHVFGIGPLLSIAGRELVLRAKTVRDYALIESRIVQLRGDPFDYVRFACAICTEPERLAETAFNAIRQDWATVSFGDMAKWLGTWDGRAFDLWTSVDGLTLSETKAAICCECDKLRNDTEAEWWWLSKVKTAIRQANAETEIAALMRIGRTENESDEYQPIPWELIFRVLSEEPFSKSKQDILDLTISQINSLWCEREKLTGGDEFSGSVQEMAKQAKEAKANVARKAASNLANGKLWNSNE